MQTDPPASSKHVSESAIQFRATEILRASISQNTHKMYQTAWRSFRDFVGQRNGSIEPSIDDAVKFISYLSCQGFASSTIKSYISAISFTCKLNNIFDPTECFIVKKNVDWFNAVRH